MVTTRNTQKDLDTGQSDIRNGKSVSKSADDTQVLSKMSKKWPKKVDFNENIMRNKDWEVPPLQQDGTWDNVSCSDESNSSVNSNMSCTTETFIKEQHTLAKQNGNQGYGSHVQGLGRGGGANMTKTIKPSAQLNETNERMINMLNQGSQMDVNMVKVNGHGPSINHRRESQCDKVHGMKVSMEFHPDNLPDEETLIGYLMSKMVTLIDKLKEQKMIGGVCDDNNQLRVNKFVETSHSTRDVRAIYKKKGVVVEAIIEVDTNHSTYALYQNQKKTHDEEKIRLQTKKTEMKFAKKVGYAVGPNVQLASPMEYAKEIQDLAHINQSLIEIKKEYTYERGQRSKVLVTHAIEQNAKEIDEILHGTMFKHF